MERLNGLCNVNVELTSVCNKNCAMCGRRERDRLTGESDYGHMDIRLVQKIAKEIPEGISVQLHNNGEPLMYPTFKLALKFFNKQVTNIVTNGKLLIDKFDEFVGILDTMSVSIFEDDPEQEAQYEILKQFIAEKGTRKPYTTARLIGKVDPEPYKALGLQIISRTLHAPKGSINYRRKPTIPEVGYCWDLFTRLAIDRFGKVSVCVRYDPNGELIVGDCNTQTLFEIWNCYKRKQLLKKHITGNRSLSGFCNDKCHYWGVPTGS